MFSAPGFTSLYGQTDGGFMPIRTGFFLLALLWLLHSCGNTPGDNTAALQARIDSLEQELDSVRQAASGLPAGDALEATASVTSASPGDPESLGAARGNTGTALQNPKAGEVSGTRRPDARAALARMKTRVDSVEQVTWYRDRSTPEFFDVPAFYLYVGQNAGGDPWLRWRIQINEGEWAFIESFIVVADGKSWNYRTTEFNRDGGTTEWEWFDRHADEDDVAMARAVMNSSSAVIRLKGRQFRKDRVITAEQKAALRHVFDAFAALGG